MPLQSFQRRQIASIWTATSLEPESSGKMDICVVENELSEVREEISIWPAFLQNMFAMSNEKAL